MSSRVGFASRLLAYLIDQCVICGVGGALGGFLGGTVLATVGAMFGASTATLSGSPGDAAGAAGFMGFFMGLFGALAGVFLGVGSMALLFIVWEGFGGTSLGKLMLGLRIAREDGTPAAVDRLLFRAAIKHLAGLLAFTAWIPGVQVLAPFAPLAHTVVSLGMLLALTESKQALHDQAAGTAVYGKT